MHLDPIMPLLAGVALAILLIGLISRRLRQPYVVGYLLAGVVLGPSVLGTITDKGPYPTWVRSALCSCCSSSAWRSRPDV